MKTSFSTATFVMAIATLFLAIASVLAAVDTYKTKMNVERYQALLNDAVVLDDSVPHPENNGKLIIFTGLPSKISAAQRLGEMPEGAIWYKHVEERYHCSKKTKTRHNSSGHSSNHVEKHCSWETIKSDENAGKIKIGNYKEVSLDNVDLSVLGTKKYYRKNYDSVTPSDKGWKGNTEKVEGNVRYKLESIELNDQNSVTVLGKQVNNSIVGAFINNTQFNVVVRKGRQSKDAMLSSATISAENAVSWSMTIILAVIAAFLLIGSIASVVYNRTIR